MGRVSGKLVLNWRIEGSLGLVDVWVDGVYLASNNNTIMRA
jgi:hypothetical protein